MDNHRTARPSPRNQHTTPRPQARRSAPANPLTSVAQSVESLRPEGAPPAWAELIGPEANPTQVRWHEGLDTLMGFAAPGDCHAIAAVGYGWARHLGTVTADRDIVAAEERRRCRVVYLLARTGDTAAYLRAGHEILIDEAPTVGRIPDLARRAPGPTHSAARGHHRRNARPSGAQQHRRRRGRRKPQRRPTHLGRRRPAPPRPPSRRPSWHRRRRRRDRRRDPPCGRQLDLEPPGAASGKGCVVGRPPPAGAGGWMDEGILSRWLLDALPTTDSLPQRIAPIVTPSAALRDPPHRGPTRLQHRPGDNHTLIGSPPEVRKRQQGRPVLAALLA